MNRTQPRPRYQGPLGPQPEHDAYLKAACAAKVPVSVFFLDGEAITRATIKQVGVFTILFEVEGLGEVLVYKNALKKITA